MAVSHNDRVGNPSTRLVSLEIVIESPNHYRPKPHRRVEHPDSLERSLQYVSGNEVRRAL